MSQPKNGVYYSDYLQLDRLLTAQEPLSAKHGEEAHDEHLFVVVHQVYELWFKQILHELDSVLSLFTKNYVDEKNIGTAVSRLQRIIEIQKLLIDQLGVLETMTPQDFLEFRDILTPASGFQSFQFRMIEIKLGLEERKVQPMFSRFSPEHQRLVRQTQQAPSLFTALEKWLERTPFLEFKEFHFWKLYSNSVTALLESDQKTIQSLVYLDEAERTRELAEFKKTEESFAALFDEKKYAELLATGQRRLSFKAMQAALLICLYRDQPLLQMPFRLLSAVIDVDELMTSWRYRHSLMALRMIGTKIGTGGTSGHQYLKNAVESHRIFTDFSTLSTFLIKRSLLPKLPEPLEKALGFYFSYGDSDRKGKR